MTAWTDYRGQARGLRGRGRAAGQSVQQAPGAPARSSHRTRGRVILPAPPGHAHGARRATFWPGPPAARTIYRHTVRREAAQTRARGRLPPRKCLKCWAWVMCGPFPPQTPLYPLRWPLYPPVPPWVQRHICYSELRARHSYPSPRRARRNPSPDPQPVGHGRGQLRFLASDNGGVTLTSHLSPYTDALCHLPCFRNSLQGWVVRVASSIVAHRR